MYNVVFVEICLVVPIGFWELEPKADVAWTASEMFAR